LTYGLFTGSLRAQAPTLDRVEVRDRKDGSVKTLTGKLTLNKNGLQVLSGDKKAILLSFDDIIRIVPGDLPGVDRLTFNSALNAEEKRTLKDYESARSIYTDLLKKTNDPAAKRHLEYRLALIATRLADLQSEGATWKESVTAAIKEWNNFLLTHTSGWEVWPATRTAARLYVDLGNYNEAARWWAQIRKLPDLPPDLVLEATLQEVDAHFRNKDYSAAHRLATEAAQKLKPGIYRDRFDLYAQVADKARNGLTNNKVVDDIVALVEDKLNKLTDPLTRATAFGILGEIYRQRPDRLRDAMWSFLWVETVYNTDKYEVHKAVVRLVEIFAALKDKDRTASQQDRLRQLRETL
jgi:tetratricopeptide (TPR) repeat protein